MDRDTLLKASRDLAELNLKARELQRKMERQGEAVALPHADELLKDILVSGSQLASCLKELKSSIKDSKPTSLSVQVGGIGISWEL